MTELELAEDVAMHCWGCQYDGPPALADYYHATIEICPECNHEATETWRVDV